MKSDDSEEKDKLINDLDEDELFELLDQIDYEKENKEIDEFEKEFIKSETIFCKKCDSIDKIAEDTSQGILVCMECGSVISDLFDNNPEWKQYAGDDGKE